jgi:hypothetical protein
MPKMSLRVKRSNLLQSIIPNEVEGFFVLLRMIRQGGSDCFVVSLPAMTLVCEKLL